MGEAGENRATIPGMPTHPMGWRVNAYRFHRDALGYLMHAQREFGQVAAFEAGRVSPVFVFGPAMNRTVLENTAVFQSAGVGIRGPDGSAQQRLASGIFDLNGEAHRRFRRQVNPAFSRKASASHFADMVAATDRVLGTWEFGKVIDLQVKARELVLEISKRTALGLGTHPALRRLGGQLHDWFDASTSVWSRLVPGRFPGLPLDRALRLADRIEMQWLRLLAGARQDGPLAQPPTTLQILANADFSTSSCPHETAQGHLHVLALASHDTTASAIMWTLYLLAQHPETADRLREEINGGPWPPDVERLERLELLDRVVTESMRLLAPVPYCSRVTSEPVELGGYPISRGTIVTLSPFVTHRLPELYAEPESFRPERWEGRKPVRYGYLPFIDGRRRCLGAGFATLTVKLMVAMFLQRFSLALQPRARIDVRARITLQSRQGIPVILSTPQRRGRRVDIRGSVAVLAP